ncbi:MAG: hypothetical protein M0R06_02990, partial [Sphaerochaeta sp.]|nr:hypothetical protein [Sphaerochaeta sp.]
TSTSGGAHTHTVSGTSGAGSSHKHAVNVASTTSGGPSATSGKYAPDPSGAYLVPAALHTHDTNPASVDSATEAAHTHGAGSYGAGSDGAHTHDVSGTTGAASATENRPKYLSVYYIMYVGRGEGGVLLPG